MVPPQMMAVLERLTDPTDKACEEALAAIDDLCTDIANLKTATDKAGE